jgi:hypothetical protein
MMPPELIAGLVGVVPSMAAGGAELGLDDTVRDPALDGAEADAEFFGELSARQ